MSQYFAAAEETDWAAGRLGHAASLAHWDQQTMMPARGSAARAEALATLARIEPRAVRRRRDRPAARGRRLRARTAPIPMSDDAALVRLTRRHWDKARRVPTELAAEQARAASVGHEAWVAARGDI